MTATALTLVLGGTRSGKSEVAERLVTDRLRAPHAELLYFATGSASDAAMAGRVAAHQRRRGDRFRTIEAGADLVGALRREPADATALVDSLGTWVAAHDAFATDTDGLCDALLARSAATVVVSDEVGLGVHPSTQLGVQFRDAVGAVNRAVAEVAGDVYLVVAGRVLPLSRGVDL